MVWMYSIPIKRHTKATHEGQLIMWLSVVQASVFIEVIVLTIYTIVFTCSIFKLST